MTSIKPRPYQTEAVNAILRERDAGVNRQLVSLPTGCHEAGARVLMFDGSLKNVEDIKAGDLLMGPDSKGRRVLSLIRGTGRMCQIIPIKGESFIVNEDHVLSLKETNLRSETSGRRIYPSTEGGKIVNISVKDYLQKSANFKHTHKLYRVGVEFESQKTALDPYFMGVMLGDGSTANNVINVTTPDKEIAEECYKQACFFDLNIRDEHNEHNKAVVYFFVPKDGRRAPKWSNPIRETMRSYGLLGLKSGEKFIPDEYKINSRDVRLQILAGLMDTDGSLTGNDFDYTSKSRRLAEDVLFIARSLGLAAYIRVKAVDGRDYYRVSISGDCSVIPVRVERKKASPRLQKKDVLMTGFKIKEYGTGEFYGFTLDCDNLYLMGDFTVTHNSGKTIVFGMLAQRLGVRTLVLAHREELLTQAVQKIRLVNPTSDIGILRAEDTTGYYTDICVASVQTAARGKRLDILRERGFELCIIDEAHHATAESYYRIASELGFMSDNTDKLLVGVTATAYRGDGVALGEVFEKVVYERSIMAMMKAGYLCDARGISVKTGTDLSEVHTRGGDFAVGELSDVIDIPARNNMVAESYIKHAKGRRAVVFCCDVAHAHNLAEAFKSTGVSCAPVWGDMKQEERRGTLEAFSRGELDVLTNCAVLTEGWDEPATSAVLLARPTKSRVLYTQMVGRGLRLYPGKEDCLVIDFADIAGRHNLCGLSTLAGDPRIKPKKNQTLLEAAEEFERTAADREDWKHAHVGSVQSEEWDLFGRSEFVWTSAGGGHYRLNMSETHSLWVRREPGGYMVWLLNRRDLSDKTQLSEEPLPFGYAQGVAEDYIRLNGVRHLVAKDAKWRANPASARQLELLSKWKIPHDPNGISSGEASALIDLELARREADKQQAATSKQRWFIRNKLFVEIPDNLTKGEASRIIADANAKAKQGQKEMVA